MVVGPRVVADLGHYYASPPCTPAEPRGFGVFEPAIAVNGSYRVLASASAAPRVVAGPGGGEFDPCLSGGSQIRWAFLGPESGSWVSDYCAPFEFSAGNLIDVSVCAGPTSSSFLIAAKTVGRIVVTSVDPGAGTGPDWFLVGTASGFPNDKPWLIRGDQSEYYITDFDQNNGRIRCYRSSDGGLSFSGGSILSAGAPITTEFAPHPAVSGAGALYVSRVLSAAVPGERRFQIFQWMDEGVGLNFEPLLDSAGQVLTVDYYIGSTAPLLPAPGVVETVRCAPFVQIAADPSSPDRLYGVLTDVGGGSGPSGSPEQLSDCDVVVVRIERSQGASGGVPGAWAVTAVRRLPEASVSGADGPVLGSYADQYCPALHVDADGWVHVTFVSNQIVCGVDQHSGAYDVYYALSKDHGASFSLSGLRTCSQRPAVNYALVADVDPDWRPREYNGIDVQPLGNGDKIVHLVYSGTLHGDIVSVHPSVIFAQEVHLEGDP